MAWEWLKPECAYPAVGANCTSTWQLEVGGALAIMQPLVAAVYTALWLVSLRFLAKTWYELTYTKHESKTGRQSYLLRFAISAFLSAASPCVVGFAATGYLFGTALDNSRGKLSYILMNTAISFYGGAAACVILIFRNVLAFNAGIKLKKISLASALSVTALPYAVVMVVLDALVIAEVYTDPVVAYRIGIFCSIPFSAALVCLVRYYGAPVLQSVQSARDQSAASPEVQARLDTLVGKLQSMIKVQDMNCAFSVILFGVIALTKVAHIPAVALVLVTSLWLGTVPFFHVTILRDMSKNKPKPSRRSSSILPTFLERKANGGASSRAIVTNNGGSSNSTANSTDKKRGEASSASRKQ